VLPTVGAETTVRVNPYHPRIVTDGAAA
jgi:hypothetical protein